MLKTLFTTLQFTILSLCLPLSVHAATLIGTAGTSETRIEFVDSNGNMRLDLDEFVSWSNPFGQESIAPDLVYIGSGPGLSPFAVSGGTFRDFGRGPIDLQFFDPSGSFTFLSVPQSDGFVWSLDLGTAQVVPVPAGALLMVSGVLAFGLLRRRDRRAN